MGQDAPMSRGKSPKFDDLLMETRYGRKSLSEIHFNSSYIGV
jgi:hypothetical protein